MFLPKNVSQKSTVPTAKISATESALTSVTQDSTTMKESVSTEVASMATDLTSKVVAFDSLRLNSPPLATPTNSCPTVTVSEHVPPVSILIL